MSGWRALLRLAWRDVRRARGRSALVLTLIALPVLAVTMAVTVVTTQDVDALEGLDRRLGAADARVTVERGTSRVFQGADPDHNLGTEGGRGDHEPLTEAQLIDQLGGARLLEMDTSEARVETDGGVTVAVVKEVDLRDPLAQGLATLRTGQLPVMQGEAVVNEALAEKGSGIGETVTLADGGSLEVVGIVEDAAVRDHPLLATLPGAVGGPESMSTTWLVDTIGPVTWEQVRTLNEQGVSVLSRAVIQDPPTESELAPEIQGYSGGYGDAAVASLVLVVTMVLIEVVLLAGPAFAVTVRRQQRTLALMTATGGTPAQSRLAVLAIALVLGVLAAVIGVVAGLGLAWAVGVPVAQRFNSSWFGPFDVRWDILAGVAGFGVLAAVLAAVVPAWLASRMDVVAVLAGRRGDTRASRRSPVLGVALLGLGVAGAVSGATRDTDGELLIAGSALVSVLGMILLVPVVLVGLARLGGRWPLVARYAIRDAARHRTRTVPAVAAVAATVAGVVALGIGATSDIAEAEATYTPQLASGDAVVTASEATPREWDAIESVTRAQLPGATVTRVRGVPEGERDWVEVGYRAPEQRGAMLLEWTGGSFGSVNLVADRVPVGLLALDGPVHEEADRALAEGRVVVMTRKKVGADTVRIRGTRWDQQTGEQSQAFPPATVPAAYVRVAGSGAPVKAIVPPAVAQEIGMPVATTALLLTDVEVSHDAAERLDESVAGIATYGWAYVERGYQPQQADRIVLWVLAALGGVLMLGGTLTATFLALSDARPDLATLAAVGAAPRVRRGVAASYALVVGGVGALLGAVVGFVPGIAITYPLTTSWSGMDGMSQTGPFLDVPWLLVLGVVVGLPLLTAAVVGLFARSRLPLVARLD